MNKLLMLMTISFATTTVFAANDFYVCEGFAGVDEYRSRINLKTNKADFFDNDATSIMTFKKRTFLETEPPQIQFTFEGKDASSAGTLRLEFNVTEKVATIYSINKKGRVEEIGSARCVVSRR